MSIAKYNSIYLAPNNLVFQHVFMYIHINPFVRSNRDMEKKFFVRERSQLPFQVKGFYTCRNSGTVCVKLA